VNKRSGEGAIHVREILEAMLSKGVAQWERNLLETRSSEVRGNTWSVFLEALG